MGKAQSNHLDDIGLPQARLLHHGKSATTWRKLSMRSRMDQLWAPMRPRVQVAASVFFGLFPLFAIAGIAAAMLWAAGFHGTP